MGNIYRDIHTDGGANKAVKNVGVEIRYGDIAPYAKESFAIVADESEFSTENQLSQYNQEFKPYANPCDLYSVALDGSALPLPSDVASVNIGVWSKQISDENGIFSSPFVISLKSEQTFSASGLTFAFDTHAGIYATDIDISWTLDGEVIEQGNYKPNSAFFYCEKNVPSYNGITIAFNAINMPFNRLKVRSIDHGHGTVFYGKDLKNVSIAKSIDPVSAELRISRTDFVVNVGEEAYSFRSGQPVYTYFNGVLHSTTFIKNAKRTAKNTWSVNSEDYIGILDTAPYYGGIYQGKNAKDILTDISQKSGVPFLVGAEIDEKYLHGFIPICSCREALKQVAFACGAVVDTSMSDKVKIFINSDSDKEAKSVPNTRIIRGQKIEDKEPITGVSLSYHAYVGTKETIAAYEAEQSGIGENIFVRFDRPLYSLEITNGEIVESGNNYAIINALDGCVLTGRQYKDVVRVKTKKSDISSFNPSENIISINNATLVSANNVDNLLDICYNNLVKRKTARQKIIEARRTTGGFYVRYGQAKYGSIMYGGKAEKIVTYDEAVNLLDNISFGTEYEGSYNGVVVEQSYSLSAGSIVKDCVIDI